MISDRDRATIEFTCRKYQVKQAVLFGSSLDPVREAHPRDEIGVRYDDMIWRLRWRDSGAWIYIYLLLEFQATTSLSWRCACSTTTAACIASSSGR